MPTLTVPDRVAVAGWLPSSTAPKALLLDWLGRDVTGCVAVAGWL